MGYKLVSLDLDGTLFNDESTVSDYNIDVIKKCHVKGLHTVVATGRPPRFTFKMIPELLSSDYVICYNGGMIFKNKRLVYTRCIEPSIVDAIIKFLSAYNARIAIECKDEIFSNFDLSHFWSGLEFSDLNSLVDFQHTSKILIQNDLEIPFSELYERFKTSCNIIQTDSGRLIEIMEKDVHKLSAVKWVADELKINLEEVIAFGDDLNDCEIIQGVGLGVAMENGHPKLKALAKQIAPTNINDGVGRILLDVIEEIDG
jgi:Cof subfamily protein (haloacid dehalogenase superfamily)